MVSSPKTSKILAGGALVSILVWQHVQATKLGYAVEKARTAIHMRRAQMTSEQVELENRLSPAQLAAAAKGRLGMIPLSPESVRILQPLSETAPSQTWSLVRGLLGLKKTLSAAS